MKIVQVNFDTDETPTDATFELTADETLYLAALVEVKADPADPVTDALLLRLGIATSELRRSTYAEVGPVTAAFSVRIGFEVAEIVLAARLLGEQSWETAESVRSGGGGVTSGMYSCLTGSFLYRFEDDL